MFMDIRAIIGGNIVKLRDHHGLSQDELAYRADITRAYLSGIEGGKRNPTIGVLANIAGALDVTLEDLVAGTAKAKTG